MVITAMECGSLSSLNEDSQPSGIKHVTKLKCQICTRYKDKIISLYLLMVQLTANVDKGLMMACWCGTNAEDEKLHTRIGFSAIDRPTTINVEGL